MLTDRIVELGDRRILLPARCETPDGEVSHDELKVILGSDAHSVLVTGETGTGKEVIADYVMHTTGRDKAKCQRINCAGIERNFVASDLFGHVKGAYTGAVGDRDGLLVACDGGVLFLDEIGWLPADLQARLLRFMETGEIRRLGDDKPLEKRVSVRIIAATNQDVGKDEIMIPDLRNRFDFEVKLPRLRSRGDDIVWLLSLPGFLGDQNVFTGMTIRALLSLLQNPFPGNIRELKKYCQRKELLQPVANADKNTSHILDDLSIGLIVSMGRWHSMIRALLVRAEHDESTACKKTPVQGRRNVLGLMAGIYDGLRRSDEYAYGRPLRTWAICPLLKLTSECEKPENTPSTFDSKYLLQLLEEEYPGVLLCYFTLQGRDADRSAITILRALTSQIEYLGKYNSKGNERLVGEVNDGREEHERVCPSNEYIEDLRQGYEGAIFEMPAPPEVSEFGRVLDRHQIDGIERRICEYSAQGNSNAEIAGQPDVPYGATKVGELLARIRKQDPELARSLKGGTAGAKKR